MNGRSFLDSTQSFSNSHSVISNLENAVKKKSNEINQLKIKIAKLQNQIGKIQIKEIKGKKPPLFEKNLSREFLRDESGISFINMKNSNVSSLRNTSDTMRIINENTTLRDQIVDLERNLNTYKVENKSFREKIQRLENHYGRANKGLEEKSKISQRLREDYDGLQKEYTNLKKELKACKGDEESLQENVVKLKL